MGFKVEPGQMYRHFKGDLYRVVAVAKHSETEVEHVVYEGKTGTWIRPLRNFQEVLGNGTTKYYRFQYQPQGIAEEII